MNKQKVASICLLISGSIIAPTVYAGVLNGKDINVKWEAWDNTPNEGLALLAVIDEENVIASDQASPDIKDFHNNIDPTGRETTYELWDIDFNAESITVTYTSRYVGDSRHQYMYAGPEGFHFEDTKGNLPDITNVTVDTSFAPFGFEPSLVSFDANNVYVDLDGSMCHIDGMASMPDCTNSDSPTGFDNTIKLNITFAGGSGNDPKPVNEFARTDAFFNWAEQKYPQYFPNHVESANIAGYHARHYPTSNVYMGTKDGRLFLYGDQFGGLLDAGEMEQWYSTAGIVPMN